MRLLLDACVPRTLLRPLAAVLPAGVSASSVHDHGLGDLDDGPLLDALTGHCEVFITVDRKLRHQQQLAHRPFGTVVLRARTNRLAELDPLVPALVRVLSAAAAGSVQEVNEPGHR